MKRIQSYWIFCSGPLVHNFSAKRIRLEKKKYATMVPAESTFHGSAIYLIVIIDASKRLYTDCKHEFC